MARSKHSIYNVVSTEGHEFKDLCVFGGAVAPHHNKSEEVTFLVHTDSLENCRASCVSNLGSVGQYCGNLSEWFWV